MGREEIKKRRKLIASLFVNPAAWPVASIQGQVGGDLDAIVRDLFEIVNIWAQCGVVDAPRGWEHWLSGIMSMVDMEAMEEMKRAELTLEDETPNCVYTRFRMLGFITGPYEFTHDPRGWKWVSERDSLAAEYIAIASHSGLKCRLTRNRRMSKFQVNVNG